MVERHTTKPKNITCMIVHSAERFVFFYNLPNVVCCLWNHATETSGSRRRVRDRPGIAITQLAKRREETDVVGVNSWLDKESGWNKTPQYFSHTLSCVSFLRWEEDNVVGSSCSVTLWVSWCLAKVRRFRVGRGQGVMGQVSQRFFGCDEERRKNKMRNSW